MTRSPHVKLASYPLALLVPLLVPLTASARMFWLSPLIVFGVLPVLGLLVGEDESMPALGLHRSRLALAYLKLLPRLYGLLWIAVLLWTASYAHRYPLTGLQLAGLIISLGISSAVAICTAHELLHRRTRQDLFLARLMTALCGYGHMFVEHLHHHATVGTPEYGATAPRGMSAYRFASRDFCRALVTGHAVECARLARCKLWVWHHKVFQDYGVTLLAVAAFGMLWGTVGVIVFLGQAIFAIFSFEIITYVHHYGLVRNATEEPGPHHAWAHHCWITNCLTFNNTFHSDHHLRPWTPYYDLHAMHGAPRLPASYFTMFCVALIPPLWYRLMHPRLDAVAASAASQASIPEWARTQECR